MARVFTHRQALGDRAYRQKKDHLITQSTDMPARYRMTITLDRVPFSSHPPASIVVTGQWIASWIAAALCLAGEEACELVARGDTELDEQFPQVIGDGRAADEQLCGDLRVGGAPARQAGDQRFLRGQRVPGSHGAVR